MIEKSMNVNDERLYEIENKVKEVIINHMELDVKPEALNPAEEFFLETHGFNSVDALELLLRIEQEFNIEISDENLNADLVRTIRSLSTYILGRILKK